MSEAVPHNTHTVEAIQQYAQSNELLGDPVTRRDYYEHMDTDWFMDEVQRVASLVRTGDASHLQAFDGQEVGLLLHDVPDYRDREKLLRETWKTAKGILHDRNLSDDDALLYAGLTVAGGIVLTHPFKDGNGRTSRVFSYLIARGTTNIDELSKLVAEHDYDSGWYSSPLPNTTRLHPRSLPTRAAVTIEEPGTLAATLRDSEDLRTALGEEVLWFLDSMESTENVPVDENFPSRYHEKRRHRYSPAALHALTSGSAPVRVIHRVNHEGNSAVYDNRQNEQDAAWQ